MLANSIYAPLFRGMGFPGGSVVKNMPANAAKVGSVPGLGRFPEEGNGNPLQYFCLGNPTDRRSLADYIVHGITWSQTRLTTEQQYSEVQVIKK